MYGFNNNNGWWPTPPMMYPFYMPNMKEKDSDPVSDIDKHIKALKKIKKMVEGQKPPEKKKEDEKKVPTFKMWEVILIMCAGAIPIAVIEGYLGQLAGVAVNRLLHGG